MSHYNNATVMYSYYIVSEGDYINVITQDPICRKKIPTNRVWNMIKW